MTMNNRLNEIMAIYSRRTGEKLTSKKLADALGVSFGNVSKWRRNEIKHYDRAFSAALCQFFDITPGELFTLEPTLPGDD